MSMTLLTILDACVTVVGDGSEGGGSGMDGVGKVVLLGAVSTGTAPFHGELR